MRAGILTNDDIPRPIARILGETHKDRINTLVTNMISTPCKAANWPWIRR